MTKKAKIITIAIVLSILALILILFCAVFCLYRQDVVFIGERNNTVKITDEQIIETAGFRTGRSIFSLDKDKAIENIEQTYPYLKVVQINTVSAIRIEIRVRERYEMYYAADEINQNYYILDEELKVLQITDFEPTGITKLESSLLGDTNIDILGITGNTVVSDFIANTHFRSLTDNLFVAMYNTVMIEEDGVDRYVTRDDIKTLVTYVQFARGYTLQESYDRIIITTSRGFIIDIGKPDSNLENKVNICFNAIDALIERGESGGTIKVTYLDNGEERYNFIRDDQTSSDLI